MYLKKAKTGLALLLCTVFFASCATVPAESSSQQNNTSSLHTSSAAVSSTEAVSSKPAASSKAPASSETVSSEVYVPLNLKQNPDEMLTTICSVAYVDKNGVLHYNPAYLPSNQSSNVGKFDIVIDTSAVPDGTKGVRGVYRTNDYGTDLLYVLMEDGTVRSVALYKREITGKDCVEQNLKTWKNVRWIFPFTKWFDHNNDVITPWGFTADEQGLVNHVYDSNEEPWAAQGSPDDGKTPLPFEQVTGIQKTLHNYFCLYADGTVKSTAQTDVTAEWKNIVQLGVYDGHFIIGLQSDGTLVYTLEHVPGGLKFEIPEKYCKNVKQILNQHFLQLADGTVYKMTGLTDLGQFPELDQIFSGVNALYGVDVNGKVICLQKEGELDDWLLSLTDVKTKSPAK